MVLRRSLRNFWISQPNINYLYDNGVQVSAYACAVTCAYHPGSSASGSGMDMCVSSGTCAALATGRYCYSDPRVNGALQMLYNCEDGNEAGAWFCPGSCEGSSMGLDTCMPWFSPEQIE